MSSMSAVQNGNGANPQMKSALTSITDMMKYADRLLWNIPPQRIDRLSDQML
jgi:hypothetical protein